MRISDWSSDVCSSDLYHELRPFFSGGKGMEDKGLPRGVVFRRVDGSERSAKCVGGSAGQSCLFQALDCVRGVRHEGPGAGREDRKSVVEGKGWAVRVDLGGSSRLKTTKNVTVE